MCITIYKKKKSAFNRPRSVEVVFDLGVICQLCTPASTEHLFRVKVCLRVSLSQQQQGHKMGLPRLLLSHVW